MKNYVVLQQIGTFKPDVKESFDELEDAKQYATLMRKIHPDWEYRVYSRIGEALQLPLSLPQNPNYVYSYNTDS